MPGYVCPFCGQTMSLFSDTERSHYLNFYGLCSTDDERRGRRYPPAVKLDFYKCPNDECGKTSIHIYRIENGKVMTSVSFHPRVPEIGLPDCIPPKILEDFMEARLILDDSPKASATLCRRCLQSMIRDFHGVKKRTLNLEILALKELLRPDEWEVIDGIRKIGNLGAHLDDDVNLIVDLNKEDAQALIDTIYYLFDAWYVTRQKIRDRHAKITGKASAIDEAKEKVATKSVAPPPEAPPSKDP